MESETPEVREILRLLKEHPHLRGKVTQWLYSAIPVDDVLTKLKAEIDDEPIQT